MKHQSKLQITLDFILIHQFKIQINSCLYNECPTCRSHHQKVHHLRVTFLLCSVKRTISCVATKDLKRNLLRFVSGNVVVVNKRYDKPNAPHLSLAWPHFLGGSGKLLGILFRLPHRVGWACLSFVVVRPGLDWRPCSATGAPSPRLWTCRQETGALPEKEARGGAGAQ